MRILLINPNTSVDMTERIAAQAQRHSQPGTEIVAATAEFGCEVIASRASYAIAAHAALDTYAKHAFDVDAVILACFGDPGLEALREISSVPVIGLLESATNEAARGHRPFAIVTAGQVWVSMLNERMQLSPHEAAFRGTYAIDATGLVVSREPESVVLPLQAALEKATAVGSKAVVLGGSALAGFGFRLTSSADLIDPLIVAIGDAERRRVAGPHLSSRPALHSRGLSSDLSSMLCTD